MSLFTKRRSPDSLKRMYNWFHRYYGGIEKSLDPVLDEVVKEKVATLENVSHMTAVDHACGSGAFTLKLAPFFKSVTGHDQSQGMLERARGRATQEGANVQFKEESVLSISLPDASVDWSFMSFALHLFSPEKQRAILCELLRTSRQGVMIIDHSRNKNLLVSLVEWLEGSWYDVFIKTDFQKWLPDLKASRLEETAYDDCMVLKFTI